MRFGLARAMRRCWAGYLLALAGWCALPDAQGGAPLVIGFDSASAPTMYSGPDQEAAGIYPAIVRKAFERMGEPVRLVAQPFNRLIAGLRAGSMGTGSLVLTPERAALADFSAPYTLEQVAVYRRRGGAAAYAGLDSLRGHAVGVMRGWSYGQRFDEARGAGQFNAEEVGSDLQNFLKLEAGRIDYALATTMAGAALLSQPRFEAITGAPTLLVSAPIRIAFNKSARRTALLQRFDEAVQAMRSSGELSQIIADELARAKPFMLAPTN